MPRQNGEDRFECRVVVSERAHGLSAEVEDRSEDGQVLSEEGQSRSTVGQVLSPGRAVIYPGRASLQHFRAVLSKAAGCPRQRGRPGSLLCALAAEDELAIARRPDPVVVFPRLSESMTGVELLRLEVAAPDAQPYGALEGRFDPGETLLEE